MLFLRLKSGEYLTIGENITIQVFPDGGSAVRVGVNAPKNLSVLRGEVRERSGAERPKGLVGPLYEDPAVKESSVSNG